MIFAFCKVASGLTYLNSTHLSYLIKFLLFNLKKCSQLNADKNECRLNEPDNELIL